MFKKNNGKGFTLMEIILVVALIAILIKFAGPNLKLFKDRGRLALIKSDSKVVRDISRSYKAINNTLMPHKKVESSDLTLAYNEERLYYNGNHLKDELVIDSGGNYFELDKEYLLDYVNTTLEGRFIVNDSDNIFYVDEINSSDIGEDKEVPDITDDGIFKVGSYDEAKREAVIGNIWGGFTKKGVEMYGDPRKKDEPTAEQRINLSKELVIPTYVMVDEWSEELKRPVPTPYKVVGIGTQAFENLKFTGRLNLKHAKYLRVIHSRAFKEAKFIGDFYSDSLEILDGESSIEAEMTIPHMYAFGSSTFNGRFHAPNLEGVGERTFEKSSFIGSFNAPKIKRIGKNAFYGSKFNQTFHAPLVDIIKGGAFHDSNFKGSLVLNEVTIIESNAFSFSKFDGDFIAPKVKRIGQPASLAPGGNTRYKGVFDDSVFKGIIDIPSAEMIGDDAFRRAEFKNKDLKLPKAKEIGIRAFESSKFTGDIYIPEARFINTGAFKNSVFTNKNIDFGDMLFISYEAFMNSEFTGELNLTINERFSDDFGKMENVFKNSRFTGGTGYHYLSENTGGRAK